jgi:hypothetical protein
MARTTNIIQKEAMVLDNDATDKASPVGPDASSLSRLGTSHRSLASGLSREPATR